MFNKINSPVLRWALLILLAMNGRCVFAAGTPPSTIISNTATVDFVVSGVPVTQSASAVFTVEEVIDVTVTWQDAANVQVLSPSNTQVLTFLVTNIGNGVEDFLLSTNSVLAGDDFDPVPATTQIWIDNGNGLFEPAIDTLYNGTNLPTLNGAVNESVTIFVVADMPAGRSTGDLANVALSATSQIADTAGQVGVIGAVLPGVGDGGVDANVGVSGATAAAIGTYEVANPGVNIVKSLQVIDTLGGTDPHPDARLRYTLQVNVNGANTIDNLVITDVVPANTTYVASSILLNGAAQTDVADAPAVDFSDFNVSNANAITVDLSQGSTVAIVPPASFTIIFEVTID